MSRLEQQTDNEFKNYHVTIILQSNSRYTGRFIECTENGFIGICNEIRPNALSRTTTVYTYFPKEIIRSIEFIIDK